VLGARSQVSLGPFSALGSLPSRRKTNQIGHLQELRLAYAVTLAEAWRLIPHSSAQPRSARS